MPRLYEKQAASCADRESGAAAPAASADGDRPLDGARAGRQRGRPRRARVQGPRFPAQVHPGLPAQHRESALTMGRGNGKTTLCAALAAACIDGPLMIQRGQVAVIAASLDQGSILFRHLLWLLGDRLNDVMVWRVVDNSQLMKIERRDTGAHVRVYGSNPASAHGLAPQIALLDEPAKWREAWSGEDVRGGGDRARQAAAQPPDRPGHQAREGHRALVQRDDRRRPAGGRVCAAALGAGRRR